MKFAFRNDRKFSIKMSKLLTEVVKEFGKTLTEATMLARSDFFEVDNDLPLINKERQKLHNRLVCKIYFYVLRERKDL